MDSIPGPIATGPWIPGVNVSFVTWRNILVTIYIIEKTCDGRSKQIFKCDPLRFQTYDKLSSPDKLFSSISGKRSRMDLDL